MIKRAIKTVSLSAVMLFMGVSLSYGQNMSQHTGHNMHSMKDSSGAMHMNMKDMNKKECVNMNESESTCSNGSMHMNMKGMTKEECMKKMNMDCSDSTCSAEETGMIDLMKIDKNKDGKVFQCPMDFDVLSDKPGEDEKCGMKLTEVTIKEAKANLIEHGFKVKQ